MKGILIIFVIIFMFVAYAYFGLGTGEITQNQNSTQNMATTSNNTIANPFQGIVNIISNTLR